MSPTWIKDAVFYEIYPQSFKDSNGDGIGDLNGIRAKLDYIRDLGCNALWINPCYDSPFMDAGYDVRDYKKVAPRYGTNEDLYRLFDETHKMGIRVLLDLVPGHTSYQHPWFQASAKADPNEFTGRYIWTGSAFEGIEGKPYISGMTERDGAYMLNFFASQPALNYGWLNPDKPWKSAIDSPEAIATREAMKDVMRFWLDRGCDGYRVDMADYLVKDDDAERTATTAIWREIREMLDRDYPEAAMISEWSNPELALNKAHFHMDFYLDHHGNGYNLLLRDNETEGGDHSYFLKDSGGDIRNFLNDYLPKYRSTKENGYFCFMTCNHDTPRPSRTLSTEELKLAYAFILTMPGVPFIYYGDEIGMRYLELRSKEGGYPRTGTRTPMQWSRGKNMGFSSGAQDDLYLPYDHSPDAPCVEEQLMDEESLLNETRRLTALRHKYEDLQADAKFEAIRAEADAPFVYRRATLLLAVNPSSAQAEWTSDLLAGRQVVYSIRSASVADDKLSLPPQSFVVLK